MSLRPVLSTSIAVPRQSCKTTLRGTARPLPSALYSRAYTLVEVLVALTLTLILMTAVVRVFSGVGTAISASRRALETFDRVRAAAATLRSDLQGVTAAMNPPARPEDGKGYLEIVEAGNAQNSYVAAGGAGDTPLAYPVSSDPVAVTTTANGTITPSASGATF